MRNNLIMILRKDILLILGKFIEPLLCYYGVWRTV